MRISHVIDDVGRGGRDSYLAWLLQLGPEQGIHGEILQTDRITQIPNRKTDVTMLHTRSAWATWSEDRPAGPVIGWAHDYGVFSPGGMNWFLRSEEICTRKVGIACAAYAYMQRCTNRHPKRLVRDIRETSRSWAAREKLDLIFVASRSVANRLIGAGASPDRVRILPYFVHPDFLSDEPSRVLEDRSVILYIGRLHESKGVHHLIEAWSRLSSDHELVIFGEGRHEYVDRLRALVAGSARPHLVTFQPWSADRSVITTILDRSNVVVVPSLWAEPFGIVGLEAMARSKPVVAYEVGGIPEWLENGRSGVLVPAGQVDHLTTALDDLLADRDLQVQMGRAGRERVARSFPWEVHSELLLGHLQDVVA